MSNHNLGMTLHGSEAQLWKLSPASVRVLLACHSLPGTCLRHAIGPCIALDPLLHSTDAAHGLRKTQRSKTFLSGVGKREAQGPRLPCKPSYTCSKWPLYCDCV